MPVDRALRVESNEDLGASHFLMTLGAPDDVPAWQPGQFAMITVGPRPHQHDPLLRRPFSIFNACGSPRGGLQILYEIMGRGTAMLATARAGDLLECLAPLGNGFAPPRQPGDKLLLVAGGIGLGLAAPARPRRAGPQARAPVVLYGCRTAAEPGRHRAHAQVRHPDAGHHRRRQRGAARAGDRSSGFLPRRAGLRRGLLESLCACGPTAMMRATAGVCAQRGVRCHVSLESTMACGFGVCVGCVVGSRERPPTARCATGGSASRGRSSSAAEIAW